jgi:guanine deaminase
VEESWFTSHINENTREIATVARLFDLSHYLETYDRHDLIGRRSVLAHNVHPTDQELKVIAARDASVSHCPTSNSALGSGLFPLTRHLAYGVRVALGTDVGAGTGFSMLKEALQAYFMQQLLSEQGFQLEPAHLLHLVTSAGADALGMADQVGDLSVGKRFDAQWLKPREGTTFDVALRNATGPEDALAKAFTLGTSADVQGVWVDGQALALT